MKDKIIYDKAAELYREWNKKINVISRKDIDNIHEHHILHSLAISAYLECYYPQGIWDGAEVLDVGTGGGFPGIPLAVEYPKAHFTLCDSIGKKIKVAQAVADGLGLENVVCVNARVESLPSTFDWVVSRAVTSLDNFYLWVEGRFNNSILYLKGGNVEEEILQMVRKFKLDMHKVRWWNIGEWLKDDYFAEKFVIEIGKDYLCPPEKE